MGCNRCLKKSGLFDYLRFFTEAHGKIANGCGELFVVIRLFIGIGHGHEGLKHKYIHFFQRHLPRPKVYPHGLAVMWIPQG